MKNFSEKGLKTRLTMLMAAQDLFHEKGFVATSVDEILAASGTGKSQFYHYFESKEDLIHQLLLHIRDTIIEASVDDHLPIKTWTDLEKWFHKQVDIKERYGFKRGCPIAAIGGGASKTDDLLLQDLSEIFEALLTNPLRFFEKEKDAGRLIEGADPDSLALYCLSSLQGGVFMSKMQQNSVAARNAIKHTMEYLKTYRKKA